MENESNGIMTYDREVIKMPQKRVYSAAESLFAVKPGSYKFTPIVPDSRNEGQLWRYSLSAPAGKWKESEFDDVDWKSGSGGFGDPKDNNPIIRTIWTTEELWLRKKFQFDGASDKKIYLKVYHQFEMLSQFYLNGKLLAEGPEHSNAYTFIELDEKLKSKLRKEENILAVYCRQNKRRAYFDAGLFFVEN